MSNSNNPTLSIIPSDHPTPTPTPNPTSSTTTTTTTTTAGQSSSSSSTSSTAASTSISVSGNVVTIPISTPASNSNNGTINRLPYRFMEPVHQHHQQQQRNDVISDNDNEASSESEDELAAELRLLRGRETSTSRTINDLIVSGDDGIELRRRVTSSSSSTTKSPTSPKSVGVLSRSGSASNLLPTRQFMQSVNGESTIDEMTSASNGHLQPPSQGRFHQVVSIRRHITKIARGDDGTTRSDSPAGDSSRLGRVSPPSQHQDDLNLYEARKAAGSPTGSDHINVADKRVLKFGSNDGSTTTGSGVVVANRPSPHNQHQQQPHHRHHHQYHLHREKTEILTALNLDAPEIQSLGIRKTLPTGTPTAQNNDQSQRHRLQHYATDSTINVLVDHDNNFGTESFDGSSNIPFGKGRSGSFSSGVVGGNDSVIPLQSMSTSSQPQQSQYQQYQQQQQQQPPAILTSWFRRRIKSYNVIRESYKLQRKQQRKQKQQNITIFTRLLHFIHQISLIFDLNRQYQIFMSILTSTSLLVTFYILDVLSDMLFCSVYLIDMEFAYAHDDDVVGKNPRWLYVARRWETFSVAVAFAGFNVLSAVFRTVIADDKVRHLFSFVMFVDLLTSAPLIVALFIRDGHLFYIPYFLRGTIIVTRLKTVLRLRGSSKFLNFDAVKEKMIILIATIISLMYVAACAFQYVEFRFAQHTLTLSQCIYFIVVTLSTVGYGDVTAQSVEGQYVVIVLILVALAVVPTLLSSLVEAITTQGSGGGTYTRGSDPFVVVVGQFDTFAKMADVLETFLDEEQGDTISLRLVFLGRNPAPATIKNVINQSLYKNRVRYLVGSALDHKDLKRAQLEFAYAAYVLPDRNASDYREEDEQNTLRAWSMDELAPLTPLYVSNLLPETETYQERTTTAGMEFILGLSTLYTGSATLLINLLHKYSPYDSYSESWKAQYGDGTGNELYSTQVNPIFVGYRFSDVCWYLYREFQVTLIGVKVFLKARHDQHHILNPGPDYVFAAKDCCIIIAQSPAEIRMIDTLTKEELETSLKNDENHSFAYGEIVITETGTHIAQPVFAYLDSKIPLCHLLDQKADRDSVTLSSAKEMSGHVLVCTGNFEVFKFVCAMRASHLTEELRPIVFLCTRLPNDEEFETLAYFPQVYFVVGDPRRKRDLIRGGISGSLKVVITNMGTATNDEFAGSPAIMVSHLIYSMFAAVGLKKCVIVELAKRAHVNYLRPTNKQTRSRKNRTRSAAANTFVSEGLDYLYSPMYAGGRVVVAAMMDCILFQLVKNPSLLDTFKLCCGVRTRKDEEYDKILGITPSTFCQIYVPRGFEHRPYGELYRELTLNHGIVPLGVYRDSEQFGNILPFVYTNPLHSLVLLPSDLIFVLSPNV
ncbi:hypothetical protein HDU76_006197 [Blyttiomyces sp. JEL0837]|nr:hypothetical protein HDU76_006197 [Blyttiomyces sp. JEL0837]